MLPVRSYPPDLWGDLTNKALGFNPPSPLPFATIVALGADGTYGNGNYAGPAFTPGDYVRLGDGSTAHYNGTIWVADALPAQGQVAALVVAPAVESADPEAPAVADVEVFVDSDADAAGDAEPDG